MHAKVLKEQAMRKYAPLLTARVAKRNNSRLPNNNGLTNNDRPTIKDEPTNNAGSTNKTGAPFNNPFGPPQEKSLLDEFDTALLKQRAMIATAPIRAANRKKRGLDAEKQ